MREKEEREKKKKKEQKKEKGKKKERRKRKKVWLVGFYGISTFVGYLTPNPFLCK